MSIHLDIEKRLGEFHLQVQYEGDRKVTGILGASGCGKSMTLKAIAGIETPDRGLIDLDGQVLFDSAKRINLKTQMRRVGYLFQNYALFPTMTVEKNIAAGLRCSKEEKKKKVGEMLERFGLENLEDRLPGNLSGGQQQRVALARILVTEPRALLLDEPFSALDGSLKERLRMEMSHLLREYDGFSVLVTHDRDEAYQLCDRLLLMDNGKVIGAGSTREIFESPGNVQAARLTGCKNISRIQRLGPNRVKALDWQELEVVTEETVGEDITHIGIRAHDFYPLSEGEYSEERKRGNSTVIPVLDPIITELPFEWYITLKQGIWWKCSKEIHQHSPENSIPYGLGIKPESVMLLRSNES
ncbi:MAG: ATP-binding cassette domain-containing protein [Lachnospiraceae bacterium]|nr:ATP-binding cassette domain-containing protein [Lachnospiraceae bacterium]